MRTPSKLFVLASTALLTACTSAPATPAGDATAPSTQTPQDRAVAAARLLTANGSEAGRVEVTEGDRGLLFTVQANGLTPGFHGLHLHAVGKCEPQSADPADPSRTGDFMSAGGHLGGPESAHPDHAGDLPTLHVGKDGRGMVVALTDRVTRAELSDPDGAALIVHGQPDNYANIPTRYASAGPDAQTKEAGDAGPRVACAVVTPSQGSPTPTTS